MCQRQPHDLHDESDVLEQVESEVEGSKGGIVELLYEDTIVRLKCPE